MNSEQLYKKAERADEMSDVDLTDADMYQIAQAVYNTWFPGTDEEFDFRYDDRQCKRAVRMLCPFREKIKGTFEVTKLGFKGRDNGYSGNYKSYSNVGLYIVALLDGTDIDKLVIGKGESDVMPNIRMGDMGGKTVEILPEGKAYNVYVSNGTVLNRGEIHEGCLCDEPSKRGETTFISSGKSWILGGHEENGLFINYGEAHSIGYKCTGGIFLNFGNVTNDTETAMGYRCSGGVIVTKTMPIGGFMVKPDGPVYGVGPDELEKDRELSRLMDEIEAIGKVPDAPKANEIARKIDAHVREKYQPRRVA